MPTRKEVLFMLDFQRIDNPDCSINSIAEQMHVSRETIRKYANSLVAKEMMLYVKLGREKTIKFTEKGSKFIDGYLMPPKNHKKEVQKSSKSKKKAR